MSKRKFFTKKDEEAALNSELQNLNFYLNEYESHKVLPGFDQKDANVKSEQSQTVIGSNPSKAVKMSRRGGEASAEEVERMNDVYEENRKLGYQINYMNEENNFFRISINNIQKLNAKITKSVQHSRQAAHGHLQSGAGQLENAFQKGNSTMPRKSSTLHLTANPAASLTPDPERPKLQTRSNLLKRTSEGIRMPAQQVSAGLESGSTGPSQPFQLISNQVHLKNLQVKVGNSIRKAEKLKKVFEGSVGVLVKKVTQLEDSVNQLSREAQHATIENQLFRNIYSADYYLNLSQAKEVSSERTDVALELGAATRSQKNVSFSENKRQIQRLSDEAIEELIRELEKQEMQQLNCLESLRKEEKQQQKKQSELEQTLERLTAHKNCLKRETERIFEPCRSFKNGPQSGKYLPRGVLGIKDDADELLELNEYERRLGEEMVNRDRLLEEQYRLNQDYKQKIIDRSEQQGKEIKVLEEEVNKCQEQVREISDKYAKVCASKGRGVDAYMFS